MKHGGADPDEGGGQENESEVGGQGQQHQAGEGEAHPDREGVGFRIPVGVKTDDRLQEGGGELVGEGDQAHLGKTEMERCL